MFLWWINAPDELKVINFSDEVTDLLHKVSRFPPVFLNESTLIMFSECAAPDLLTVNSRRRSFCGLQAAFIHSHLALWFNYFFFFFLAQTKLSIWFTGAHRVGVGVDPLTHFIVHLAPHPPTPHPPPQA